MKWTEENQVEKQPFSFSNGSEAAWPSTRTPDSTGLPAFQSHLTLAALSVVGGMLGGAITLAVLWMLN